MSNGKLNKYEKKIMLGLTLIRVLCGVGIVLNIVLPLVDNLKFNAFLVSQILPIAFIYIYSLVNVVGYQGVPIIQTFIIRFLQSLIFVLWAGDISWVTFGVLVFVDVLLCMLLTLDKGSYEYVYIKASDDEFMDI